MTPAISAYAMSSVARDHGTYNEVMDNMTGVVVYDLTNYYSVVAKYLSTETAVLDKSVQLYLFKIIYEISVIVNAELMLAGTDDLHDTLVEDTVHEELEYSMHKKALKGNTLSNLAIHELCSLIEARYDNDYDNDIDICDTPIPLGWSLINPPVLLHMATIE